LRKGYPVEEIYPVIHSVDSYIMTARGTTNAGATLPSSTSPREENYPVTFAAARGELVVGASRAITRRVRVPYSGPGAGARRVGARVCGR